MFSRRIQNIFSSVISEDVEKLKIHVNQMTDTQIDAIIDGHNNNLLHIAVLIGNKQIIEYLLTKNVDINFKNVFGQSPLQNAMNKKDEEIIKLIMTYEIKKYESPIIESLKADNIKLSKKNEIMSSKFDDLFGMNKTLTADNIKLQKLIEEKTISNKRMSEQNADLETKIVKLRKTVSTLISNQQTIKN